MKVMDFTVPPRWKCNCLDTCVTGGKEQKVIEDAMKEWETYTCLRFKPAEDNRDKIVFQIGNGYACPFFLICW